MSMKKTWPLGVDVDELLEVATVGVGGEQLNLLQAVDTHKPRLQIQRMEVRHGHVHGLFHTI